MARFKFGRKISLRWNGLLIEGPAETVFEIPDEYYEEFEQDIHPVEPTLVWLDSDEGATLRSRVTALEAGGGGGASLSNNTPVGLGTAAPGSGTTASRHDHVHPTTGLSLTGHTHDTAGYTTIIKQYVKNDSTSKLKGEAVYISSADGTNPIISYADADTEATSSKTLGLLEQNLSANQHGWVVTEGVITNIDTGSAIAGQTVWLSGTAGGRVYGAPPAEPAHGVYLGVVTKANASTGEIFVKVQNGYELDELHNVSAGSPSNGDIIQYNSSSQMWENESLSTAGIAAATHSHAESDVTNLTTDLAGKAPLSHTHSQSDVTSLTSTLAGKSDTSHNHNGTYDPVGTASSAVSTHAAVTTSVHGISNTANLVDTSSNRILPSGGTTGQVLSKVSGTNYDVTWSTASGGGASLSNTNAVALGTASAGTASEASRQDHVHPTTNLATLTGTETLTNKTLTLPSISNTLNGYTTTVSSGTAITLTNTSTYYQFFTGSSFQNIYLPVASTMVLGQSFLFVNKTTSSLIIMTSAGTTVQSVSTGHSFLITCILTSGTTTASWDSRFFGTSTGTTGSSQLVFANAPTIAQPTISTRLTVSNGVAITPRSITASAGSTSLSSGDGYIRVTGTTTHTLILTSSSVPGLWYWIRNDSTGAVTVNASGGSLVATIAPSQTVEIIATVSNGTTPSDWYVNFRGGPAVTGTGSSVLATSPTLTSPTVTSNFAITTPVYANYDKAGTSDTTTITTAGTYYALTNAEVSFTPQFVGQRILLTFTGYASINTTVIQYCFVRANITDSSNVIQGSDLGFSRAENFGTSGRGGTVAFTKIWVADTTSARKFKLYGTVQTTDGLVLTLAYTQMTVMSLN